MFFFSAAFHEIIISIPFRCVSLHAFFGMLLQAPLVYLTKNFDKMFDNPFIGNAFFWLVFCVIGQPMGVLMYYYDLSKSSHSTAGSVMVDTATAFNVNTTSSGMADL